MTNKPPPQPESDQCPLSIITTQWRCYDDGLTCGLDRSNCWIALREFEANKTIAKNKLPV